MIARRTVVIALGAGALVIPLTPYAQQPAKIFRIGFLGSESASAWAARVESFRKGILDRGYLEGKNVVIEFRWAEGKYDQLPELAAELVRLKVDVIVTGTSGGALAAQHATATTPIVIGAIGDVVDAGLVTNLAHPGGNVTGSTFFDMELSAKRIELLKDAFPRARRIGALMNPDNPGKSRTSTLGAMNAAARSLKVELQIFEARRPNEFESAFSAMAKARVDAVAIPNQPIFDANEKVLAELAVKHRLPSISGSGFAEAGGLIGYGASFLEMYHRAASFVDKIFKGAKPGDLPIERPTKFDFVINKKTGKTLGIKFPNSILVQATKVIE